MPPGMGRLVREITKDRSKFRSPSPERSPDFRGSYGDDRGPRSFPHDVKIACWERAAKVKGRDPDRWRMDPLGNVVFRKLVACDGCVCFDYDHIKPYSRGGKSDLDNCQVMQTAANRAKSNRVDVTNAELMQRSAYCRLANNKSKKYGLGFCGV